MVTGVGFDGDDACAAAGSDELIDGALSEDFAVVDNGDEVADALGLFHVVGGVDDGAALIAQGADDVEDGVAGLRVDAGGRLIEQDERGIVDERGGEVEASLHAAGVFLDAVACAIGEANAGEETLGTLATEGTVELVEGGEEVEVLDGGEFIVKREGLGGDADSSADGGIERGTRGVEIDGARIWLEQADGDADRRGLACAVRAEEAEDRALGHGE